MTSRIKAGNIIIMNINRVKQGEDPSMEKNTAYFLESERVALRSIEHDDIAGICRWLNDPIVTHYMFYGQMPMNLIKVEELMNNQIQSPHNAVFLAIDKKTKKAIGFAGLYDIHLTAHKAEFRVLIGEKEVWNKGYGTEITELLTYYGFDRLNLHRVWLGFTSENKGAEKAYQKAGYVVEGRLRHDIYRNSRYYDSVRMAILKDKYYEKFYTALSKRFRKNEKGKQ